MTVRREYYVSWISPVADNYRPFFRFARIHKLTNKAAPFKIWRAVIYRTESSENVIDVYDAFCVM